MSWPADPGTAATTEAPPTCYRHPGRETYIACQRCGRHICPECMRPAAVGFQCPECVAEGAASVRRPRSETVRRLRSSGTPVTYGLMALCVLVYLGQVVHPAITARYELFAGPFAPPYGGVAGGQWYRLVTAIFLHQSVIHIGVNMMSLYFVGRPLEISLGRVRFLAVFFIGGLGGSAAAYVLSPQAPTIGASGAIFAVFGTLIVVARKVGADLRGMIGILVLNLVLSFSGNISWQAHIGGLVSGLLMGLALVRTRGRHSTLIQAAGVAAVFVIVVVAVVAKTAQLGGSLV